MQVAVKGIPNTAGFDDIHAFVNSKISEADISEFCQNNLPDLYQPILHVQNQYLPKLPNGKYDKSTMVRNVTKI